jgi:hypothetical protein
MTDAGGLEIPVVRGEGDAVTPDEQGRVRALEPGQPADVHAVRDEERRRAEAIELGPQPLDARRAHARCSARWTSASR